VLAPKGLYVMSGRQIGASVVARRQTQLMRTIIYDGSVLGQTWDPLEWFPFNTPVPLSGSATPDLGLDAAGFICGWVLPG
jgi:hypothetical protein